MLAAALTAQRSTRFHTPTKALVLSSNESAAARAAQRACKRARAPLVHVQRAASAQQQHSQRESAALLHNSNGEVGMTSTAAQQHSSRPRATDAQLEMAARLISLRPTKLTFNMDGEGSMRYVLTHSDGTVESYWVDPWGDIAAWDAGDDEDEDEAGAGELLAGPIDEQHSESGRTAHEDAIARLLYPLRFADDMVWRYLRKRRVVPHTPVSAAAVAASEALNAAYSTARSYVPRDYTGL